MRHTVYVADSAKTLEYAIAKKIADKVDGVKLGTADASRGEDEPSDLYFVLTSHDPVKLAEASEQFRIAKQRLVELAMGKS